MQKDDIVSYKVGDGREELAVILMVHSDGTFTIKFVSDSLIPSVMVVPKYRLSPFALKSNVLAECECGLKGQQVSSRAHYRFCPRFRS